MWSSYRSDFYRIRKHLSLWDATSSQHCMVWEVRHAAVLWEVPVSVPLAAAGRLFVWWKSETLAIFSQKGPGPAGPPDEALKAELKKQNEEEEVATLEWKHHETWWKHGVNNSERALRFFGLRLSKSRQRSEIIHRFFLRFRRGFRRFFVTTYFTNPRCRLRTAHLVRSHEMPGALRPSWMKKSRMPKRTWATSSGKLSKSSYWRWGDRFDPANSQWNKAS